MEELLRKKQNATVPQNRRLGSCAVVGSSGTLLHQSLGKEIDAHESVIRINTAPLTSRYACGMPATGSVGRHILTYLMQLQGSVGKTRAAYLSSEANWNSRASGM